MTDHLRDFEKEYIVSLLFQERVHAGKLANFQAQQRQEIEALRAQLPHDLLPPDDPYGY